MRRTSSPSSHARPGAGVSAVEIDEVARRAAVERYALPECLHVPVAANDEAALRRFVGDVVTVLAPGTPNKALLVHRPPPGEIDARLPIWKLPSAAVLHAPLQVWAHVDYPGYRKAYNSAFQGEDLAGRVIDHVRNRRVARVRGFQYVRLVPISRGANSSSGWTTESLYEFEYHSSRQGQARETHIEYADLADITKMLDLKTGGSLQDGVNQAHALLRPT